MSITSSVLELLRSSYNEETCEYLKSRSNSLILTNLQNANNYKEKLVKNLETHTKQLEVILDNLFRNGRSKYNYIVDGIDFISHVRTKTEGSVDLYDTLTELYSIESQIADINKELSRRLIFSEIDVEAIMSEYMVEDYKKSPKLLSLIPRKKKKIVHKQVDDDQA